MEALATLGACFGVLAITALVCFFPSWLKQRDEITRLRYDLEKLKADFADGLRELQEQSAAPDETGMWIQRPDPMAGTTYAKQQDRSVQAHVASQAEVDDILKDLTHGLAGRN